MISLFHRSPETGKIVGLKRPKGIPAVLFFITGIASVLWFLVRVIPKPSRITYPCMKATMPVAYSFIMYLLSLAGSVLFFKKAINHWRKHQYYFGLIFSGIVVLSGITALVYNQSQLKAVESPTDKFVDPLGPNVPIGEPKGILPGRVVWVWNPDATNENCTNSSHSDAYWLESNCNQELVDSMFSEGIKSVTGKETDAEAWDTIFRYFNANHEKGDTGYIDGETIFIKINAVTAWNGAEPDGEMPPGLSIEFDTSPQSIMAMLRQLVNVACIPQENIFIGDPMCDIYNNLYDKFYAEFPDINYVSQGNVTGRYKLTPSTEDNIIYSDHGTVMTEVTSHRFFDEMVDADYLLNIPSMKGHRLGGITFFAKNHFGSNTADHSWELHKGLMKPDDDPLRSGYYLYRVFVDLMADKELGGKTLLYYMDALWTTSYEHQKPQKFQTAPFNNDWCSSLFFSLDPVAVESVCLDIMQKEFTVQDISADPPRYTYVQWDGVDDYLHQAASSEWWPEDITYDPDETGSPIPSLGVHEHWNNVDDMQYTRNLGTGEGIELIKLFHPPAVNAVITNSLKYAINLFPNPCYGKASLVFELPEESFVSVQIFTAEGRLIKNIHSGVCAAGPNQLTMEVNDLVKGLYFCKIQFGKRFGSPVLTKKLYIN